MFRTKAYRRHHMKRLKQKRAKYWHGTLDNPRRRGKVYRTPCVCSCPMCGNPRRHFGKRTMAEQRLVIALGKDGYMAQ